MKSAPHIPSLSDALVDIHGSIRRKKAAFDLVMEGPEFILVAGSFRAVQLPEGTLVTMSVNREQLQLLRARCNELLAKGED